MDANDHELAICEELIGKLNLMLVMALANHQDVRPPQPWIEANGRVHALLRDTLEARARSLRMRIARRQAKQHISELFGLPR